MQDNSAFGVVFLYGTRPAFISEKTKVKSEKKHEKT